MGHTGPNIGNSNMTPCGHDTFGEFLYAPCPMPPCCHHAICGRCGRSDWGEWTDSALGFHWLAPHTSDLVLQCWNRVSGNSHCRSYMRTLAQPACPSHISRLSPQIGGGGAVIKGVILLIMRTSHPCISPLRIWWCGHEEGGHPSLSNNIPWATLETAGSN